MLYHLVVEQGGRARYTRYYLPLVEVKDYNVVINGWNFFDHPIKNNLMTYDNIWKIATGQGDDYTTDCLLDYPYFKNYYKMIAIDLRKQQALDTDTKAIQQISFTANLDWAGNTTNLFHYWRSKRNHCRFFTRNCYSIVNFFYVNIISV